MAKWLETPVWRIVYIDILGRLCTDYAPGTSPDSSLANSEAKSGTDLHRVIQVTKTSAVVVERQP